MKNKFKLLIGAALAAGLTLLCTSVAFADTVYISTAEELTAFAQKVNKGQSSLDAVLTNDIAFNGGSVTADSTDAEQWIGIGTNDVYSYKGTFDGQGHTISGIYINQGSSGYNKALFGCTDGATIKNLTVDKSYICGYFYVGGIVGYSKATELDACVNRATVVSNGYYAGGMVGYVKSDTNITNCSNEGNISSAGTSSYYYGTGGIVGYGNTTAVISNCRNLGDVSAAAYRVGGIVGYGGKSITDSYSVGSVTGKGSVGSICGSIVSALTISNCYYIGEQACGNDYNNKADATQITQSQLTSGELCYLLNGSEQGVKRWYQKIDTDTYPSTDSERGKVYLNADMYCPDTLKNKVYNNNSGYINVISNEHKYTADGFCEYCNGTQPLTEDSTTGEYLISNAGQLYSFVKLVNGGESSVKARLVKDIALTGDSDWTPIEDYEGTFDGDGFTISGLHYSTEDYAYNIALFEKIASSGVVKNLNITDCNIDVGEGSKGAAICGYNFGSIINCDVTATIKGEYCMGGIAGTNYGSISECSFNGSVSGTLEVGGIAGYSDGSIAQSRTFGTVTATQEDSEGAGGIAGYNRGAVVSCYSVAEVKSNSRLGGLVGTNGDEGSVTDSYCLEGVSPVGNNMGIIKAKQKDSAAFSNGEVCYLLNKATTNYYWRQNLNDDAYPVGDTTHSIVYVSGRQLCPNYIENASYNNISDEVVVVSDEHTYNSNGFCTYCGETETASLNEDGFYEIANYGQLVWFAEAAIKDCNINGLLVADITANEGVVSSECNSDDMLVWKSFGTGNGYYGIFDGAGHTISGLYCSTGEWGVSFVATNHGTIKNVNITNSYFEGNGGVGAVCGINCGTITACSAVAEVVCTLIYPEDSMNVGGICGYNSEDGVVEYCYSKGSVSGNTCGGIAGGNYGKISNCYTLSTVSGDSNVGVICGTNEGSIDNCYYIGSNSAVATDSGTTVAHNMTTEDFASGSVCYALNTGDNVFFYQTLSGEDKDESPVLDSTHRMVFKTSDGYINYKLGDVDLNGSVEKTDSAYLLRYLCGADTTALIRDVADVNRDGVVDMLDAVAVVKIAG